MWYYAHRPPGQGLSYMIWMVSTTLGVGVGEPWVLCPRWAQSCSPSTVLLVRVRRNRERTYNKFANTYSRLLGISCGSEAGNEIIDDSEQHLAMCTSLAHRIRQSAGIFISQMSSPFVI